MVRAALIVVLLAGCAHRLPPAVEVQVPVPVPCIKAPPARPSFLADSELHAMPDYNLVLALAADRRSRQIYEAQIEAVLTACVDEGSKEPARVQPAERPP